MVERDTQETPIQLEIPTIVEQVEVFLSLSDEVKEAIYQRATVLRYGPTGYNEQEAILVATSEYLDEKTKTIIGSQSTKEEIDQAVNSLEQD